MPIARDDSAVVLFAALRQYELGKSDAEVSAYVQATFGHLPPDVRIPALVSAARARDVATAMTADTSLSVQQAAERAGVPLGNAVTYQVLVKFAGQGEIDPSSGARADAWRTVRFAGGVGLGLEQILGTAVGIVTAPTAGSSPDLLPGGSVAKLTAVIG